VSIQTVFLNAKTLIGFKSFCAKRKTAPKGTVSFLQGQKDLKPMRFWRSCQIKKTVQIIPTAPPFVLLALLNLMPFDALLMLLKNLPCKADAQLPKIRHT